jgi:ketosteroid isomerase-like protein
MAARENKELVRQFFHDYNELGVDAAKIRACSEKYLAPSFVYHHQGKGIGLQEWREFVAKAWSAIPDASFSVDDIVAEADKVVVMFTFVGASGEKRFSFKGVEIERIKAGKFVDTWDFWDPGRRVSL